MSLFSLNWIYKLNRHTPTPLTDVQTIFPVHLRLTHQRRRTAEALRGIHQWLEKEKERRELVRSRRMDGWMEHFVPLKWRTVPGENECQ